MADPIVVLKITSVKGTCAAGHKVGDEFDLSKDFVLDTQATARLFAPLHFMPLSRIGGFSVLEGNYLGKKTRTQPMWPALTP